MSLVACEPIPVLFFFWAGPSFNLAMLTKSVAVLGFVVLIKAILYACFAPGGFARGVLTMMIANVISTIPGVVIGVLMMASPVSFLISLVLIAVVAGSVGVFYDSRLAASQWQWLTPGGYAGTSVCLALASAMILAWIPGFETEGRILYYWLGKVGGLFLGLLVSITLTIAWEAMIALRLSLRGTDPDRVLRAAVHANLWTFFGVFLLGAIIAVPIRMRRTDFLMPFRG